MRKLFWSFIGCIVCGVGNAASLDLNAPKTIVAPKIEYDVKSESIQTTGKTEITNQSGQKMTLTDSYISQQGENVSGGDIQLWLGNHVYMESETLSRDGNMTIAHDAIFTACDGCDAYGNAW